MPFDVIIILLVPLLVGDIFAAVLPLLTIFAAAPKPFKFICGVRSLPFAVGLFIERSATIPEGTVKDKAF